ncbi:MAG: hypothetical protein Q8779_02605, partial [Candidatus Phytoplasma stylosanthis]|uniref:hypothetical protein n=1 Tax=Candidatus Phytoplasma stylosanthis TaxID=2798314 RepID=UPI00293ABFDC
RYEKGLHTFISSNFNLAQLMQHFMIGPGEKDKMRALRMIDRLKKMCQFYSFDHPRKELS